ncbi:TetR/AcrR family transcriptional regulator [Pseudoroseomonas globiformis]|uniref:TetR/AcrR family transcriptional regulator n=1 Tax=Teichococcus globiformis TaxID=2307229 RepID=A0ABV7G7U1_9PROT
MSDDDLPGVSPKRRAILEGAAALFMAEGFGAVSMDAVARTAGVSKATLYAYFSGKDALFAEIIRGNCRRMQAAAPPSFSSHDLPLDRALVEFGEHWLNFLLQPQVRALHRMVIAECGRIPELARAFYEAGPLAVRAWVAGWLAEEVLRGRLRPGTDPDLAAEQFLSLLRGDLFLRATLGLEPQANPEAVSALARQAAAGFLAIYAAIRPLASERMDSSENLHRHES